MRFGSKRKLKKCEAIFNLIENPKKTIAIYNPNIDGYVIDCPFVIALPDNQMDSKLTEKIGNGFILL